MCTTVSAWPELVLYRALLGLAVSGITAAVTVYICEEVSPVLAGVVTGYFIFGNSLGSMSGRVFATLMMEHVSLNVIFMLFGGLLIFMAFYVLYFLPASKNFTPSTALNLTQMLKGGIDILKTEISLWPTLSALFSSAPLPLFLTSSPSIFTANRSISHLPISG